MRGEKRSDSYRMINRIWYETRYDTKWLTIEFCFYHLVQDMKEQDMKWMSLVTRFPKEIDTTVHSEHS